MSQFAHDDFAKAYLPELLRPIGHTIPNHPLKAESRFADLWFRRSDSIDPLELEALGLVGQLFTRDALIEVFRNSATLVEIRNSQSKLSYQETEEINKAKQKGIRLKEADLPWLWLIMPTASKNHREGFKAEATEHPGVYQLPTHQRTSMIVVHQLEKEQSTLWLRILGRSNWQKWAIEELSKRKASAPMTTTIEELLSNYRAILESRRSLTTEEEELIMNLSTVYLKQRETWKSEGLEEGQRSLILRLLARRVGPLSETLTDRIEKLPIEQLETLAEDLLDFRGMPDLMAWLKRDSSNS